MQTCGQLRSICPVSLHTGHGAHETYRVGIVFLLRVRWPGREVKHPPLASVKVKNCNVMCQYVRP
jgi:hypothetical protein